MGRRLHRDSRMAPARARVFSQSRPWPDRGNLRRKGPQPGPFAKEHRHACRGPDGCGGRCAGRTATPQIGSRPACHDRRRRAERGRTTSISPGAPCFARRFRYVSSILGEKEQYIQYSPGLCILCQSHWTNSGGFSLFASARFETRLRKADPLRPHGPRLSRSSVNSKPGQA